MNLFELNDIYRQLSQRDDLDPTTLIDSLKAIKDDREVKLENLATWADQLKSEIEFLEGKQKLFRDELIYRRNKLKWIKRYMTDVMDDAGIKKLQTDNHLLSTRNFKASTVIDDFDTLPDDYKIKKTEIVGNKNRIYQALKAGETIPGAHLEDNRSVVIK